MRVPYLNFPFLATAALSAGLVLFLSGCNQSGSTQQPEPTAANPEATQPAAEPGQPGAPGQSTPSAATNLPPAAPARPAPPAAPVIKTYTLPEGTPVRIRTTSALSTKTATPGQAFAATLVEPLAVDGQLLAPKGAHVTGQVAEADDGGRVKGRAHIAIRLTQIRLDSGEEVDLSTNAFTKLAPATKKKDAVKVGVASGVGAAIGAIAGGGRGAAIGAGVGAGAGTGAVLATKGDPAVIAAESVITFKLAAPVEVKR